MVQNEHQELDSVDAVIDKDLTSAILAIELEVDRFILTEVLRLNLN